MERKQTVRGQRDRRRAWRLARHLIKGTQTILALGLPWHCGWHSQRWEPKPDSGSCSILIMMRPGQGPKSFPVHKTAVQWEARHNSLVSDRSERQLQITEELLPRRDTTNCQAGITHTSPALLPSPRPGHLSTAQCPSPSSCILSLQWKAIHCPCCC